MTENTLIASITSDVIEIDTGILAASIPLSGTQGLENVSVNGLAAKTFPLILSAGAILGESETDPVIEYVSDNNAQSYIEQNGHLRAVVVTEGHLINNSDEGFDYTLRHTFSRDSEQAKLSLTLTCKAGTVVRGGTIPTILLDHITMNIDNVHAQVVSFGSGEDMHFNKSPNSKLILNQMEPYIFEIKTESN